ncbi:MAG: ABC transporter substrate-binding protein, partial [Phycisphaerales bacterium]
MRNLMGVIWVAGLTCFCAPLVAQTDSWARDGVAVVRSPARGYASDPRGEPGFRDGGTFTELIPTKLQTLTPTLVRDAAARRIVALVMEPLAALDPETLTLRGVLADSWQADPEGKWLRVHINPLAKFSDGRPVRAADVEFSFTRLPGGGAAAAKVTSVKALAEDVVEFEFETARFSNVPDVLTGYVFAEHVYGGFTEAQLTNSTGLLFGSGPFVLAGGKSPAEQWKTGSVTLERSTMCWGPPPVLERVVFIPEPDAKVARRRFLAEDIDAMTPSAELYVEASTDEAFLKVAEARELLTFANNWQGVLYHCGEREGRPSVFADARVRRAMTMLL